MANISFFYIILIPTILLCLYYILYKFLKKNLDSINSFILQNGHDALAEIIGYTLIRHDTILSYRNNIYNCIVLKFKDINNTEHVIVDTRNHHSFINFNKGDLINIKYIESNYLDNNLLSKDIYFNKPIDTMKVDIFYDYEKKIKEQVTLTDDNNTFLTIILDSPTRSKKSIILKFSICVCLFILIAYLFIHLL